MGRVVEGDARKRGGHGHVDDRGRRLAVHAAAGIPDLPDGIIGSGADPPTPVMERRACAIRGGASAIREGEAVCGIDGRHGEHAQRAPRIGTLSTFVPAMVGTL